MIVVYRKLFSSNTLLSTAKELYSDMYSSWNPIQAGQMSYTDNVKPQTGRLNVVDKWPKPGNLIRQGGLKTDNYPDGMQPDHVPHQTTLHKRLNEHMRLVAVGYYVLCCTGPGGAPGCWPGLSEGTRPHLDLSTPHSGTHDERWTMNQQCQGRF